MMAKRNAQKYLFYSYGQMLGKRVTVPEHRAFGCAIQHQGDLHPLVSDCSRYCSKDTAPVGSVGMLLETADRGITPAAQCRGTKFAFKDVKKSLVLP